MHRFIPLSLMVMGMLLVYPVKQAHQIDQAWDREQEAVPDNRVQDVGRVTSHFLMEQIHLGLEGCEYSSQGFFVALFGGVSLSCCLLNELAVWEIGVNR